LALLQGQSVSINPQFIQNYNQDSTGFTMFASYPVKRLSFTRLGLTYGLTRTSITLLMTLPASCSRTFSSAAFPVPALCRASFPVRLLHHYLQHDRHPTNQHSGKSYFYSLGFTGGPLGGNVNTITNVFDWKYFIPFKNVVMSSAFTPPPPIPPDTRQGSAPLRRFYMGGETTSAASISAPSRRLLSSRRPPRCP